MGLSTVSAKLETGMYEDRFAFEGESLLAHDTECEAVQPLLVEHHMLTLTLKTRVRWHESITVPRLFLIRIHESRSCAQECGSWAVEALPTSG